MRISEETRSLVRELRKTKSVSQVHAETGVSRSIITTISSDIPNPNFKKLRIAKWQAEAKEEFVKLQSNPLFMLGIGLYWGEGEKKGTRLGLCNCDSGVIVKWNEWCDNFIIGFEKKVRFLFIPILTLKRRSNFGWVKHPCPEKA